MVKTFLKKIADKKIMEIQIETSKSCDQDLKHLIQNVNEPILFKNQLNWELLQWNLKDWERILQDNELLFRCGKNAFTKEPQWERSTKNMKGTFKDFLTFTETASNDWMYFDYKYLNEWLMDVEEFKSNIDWSSFGFPEITSKDCTIWIGSKGAHTSCHVDTYGYNLIAQLYGPKLWLLFPPEENLKPTRVPYEESSIYSKLNFFSPSIANFKGIKNCRRIILQPGDVLFVPHKWWHYVENLDTAISINVWLPMPKDDEERLEESLVQMLVSQIVCNLDTNLKEILLNPNSDAAMEKISFGESLKLVDECKDMFKRSKKQALVFNESFNLCEMIQKYPFLEKIPVLPKEMFQDLIQTQSNRFTNIEEEISETYESSNVTDLINACTNPDVISLIKHKLFL